MGGRTKQPVLLDRPRRIPEALEMGKIFEEEIAGFLFGTPGAV
jgi:hypothetical protein